MDTRRRDSCTLEIQEATGYEKAEVWILELTQFVSVRSFCDKFEKEVDRLDLFIANAAVAYHKYTPTPGGWDETYVVFLTNVNYRPSEHRLSISIQVNDLSTSLLCLRLLPLMVSTAKKHGVTPRITVVSSGVHFEFHPTKEMIESEKFISYVNSEEFYCSESVASGNVLGSSLTYIP